MERAREIFRDIDTQPSELPRDIQVVSDIIQGIQKKGKRIKQ